MTAALRLEQSGTTAPKESSMPIVLEDLPGMRFGMVTVTQWSHRDAYWNNYFECVCDCGTVVVKRASQLRYGKFHTCGAETCRFWEKVDKETGPVISKKLGRCHVWTGALHSGGYGVFKAEGSKEVHRAHVYAWELVNGPVPEGMHVLHKCDHRPCTRESHLYAGTDQQNKDDMVKRGRSHASRRKVSDEVRASIRSEYAAGGVSQDLLATKYEITARTVRRILDEV